jgi:hypothetical protein
VSATLESQPRPPPENKTPRAGGALQSDNGRTASADRNAVDQRAQEQPEHRSERRRFLIWALMIGAVPPERVVERVVREVEGPAL